MGLDDWKRKEIRSDELGFYNVKVIFATQIHFKIAISLKINRLNHILK